MPNVTETEIWGLSENVQGAFVKEKPAITRVGLDVDEALARMRALHEEAFGANQQQEALKRQLRAQTEYSRMLQHKLYLTVSGYLDMAIAALGKSSGTAKILQRFRSRIRRPDVAKADATVDGGPAPGSPA